MTSQPSCGSSVNTPVTQEVFFAFMKRETQVSSIDLEGHWDSCQYWQLLPASQLPLFSQSQDQVRNLIQVNINTKQIFVK